MEIHLNEPLLNRQKAALFLGGICLTTLNRLNIQKVRIRRRVFYRVVDLQHWLEDQAVSNGEKNGKS
jgi:hypothetical protein